MFASPTKIECNDIDHFNLNWLDNSFTDDLDSILTTPSEGKPCDIKEIINSICSTEATTSTSLQSEMEGEGKAPVAKLSKCLHYIEHLSPTKQSHSIETTPPTRQNAHESTANKKDGSVWTPGPKSSKKIRNGFKKNSKILPAQPLIVEQQQQLGALDWLDVVSKIEPEQMQQFEFATPAQLSVQNQPNTAKSADPTQTVLIELIDTSASCVSNGDQFQFRSSNSEPCFSYQLNLSETTEVHCKDMSTVHRQDPMTTQTLEQILSGDPTPFHPPASNVEHSTIVGVQTDFQIIKTKYGAGSSRSQQKQTRRAIAKPLNPSKDDVKSKTKNEQRKRKVKDKKSAQVSQVETKKMKIDVMDTVMPVNRNDSDVEVEENFRGFGTIEPFKPITLARRRRPLVWLKVE